MTIAVEWDVKNQTKQKKPQNFVFTNSEDPDEMPHYAAFHLGLHCLPRYPFRGGFECELISLFMCHFIWVFTLCQGTRLGVGFMRGSRNFRQGGSRSV